MGSDDGVKGKNLSLRQWRFVAVFFAVVCALLVAEQRLAATRSARRSLRAGLRAAAVPPSPLETSPRSALLQPPPLPRALRPAPPLTLAFPPPPTQTPPNPLAADPPAAEVDDVDVDDDDDALRVPPQPRVVGPKSLKRQYIALAASKGIEFVCSKTPPRAPRDGDERERERDGRAQVARPRLAASARRTQRRPRCARAAEPLNVV